jgi:hypothetical protein
VHRPENSRPAEPGKPDIDFLVRVVGDHRADGEASRAAAYALAASGALEEFGDLTEGHDVRRRVTDALADLVVNATESSLREDAVIALAAIDRSAAVTACYSMFARHRDGSGMAGRLLVRFTGDTDSSIETLVARLPHCDNFHGVLTQEALAAHGAAAVPALLAALRAFPIPARQGTDHWFEDETTKFRLLHALTKIGAAAAPAIPALIALLQDMEGYRDTRHQAKTALIATELPETAEALIAELPRSQGGDGLAWDGDGLYLLLDALSGMPPEALSGAHGLDDILADLRDAPSEWLRGQVELITDKVRGT